MFEGVSGKLTEIHRPNVVRKSVPESGSRYRKRARAKLEVLGVQGTRRSLDDKERKALVGTYGVMDIAAGQGRVVAQFLRL